MSQHKMREHSASRRTQFSSCDACRRSRVACDASRLGYQPGQSGWEGTCSRCFARNQSCTFEWIKRSPNRLRKDPNYRSVPTPTESFSSESPGQDLPVTRNTHSTRGILEYTPHDALAPQLISARHLSMYESELASNSASGGGPSVLEPDPKSNSVSDTETVEELLAQWGEAIFENGFGSVFGRWVGRNGCPFVDDPTSDLSISPIRLFTELDTCMNKQLDGNPSYASMTLDQREEMNFLIERSLRHTILSFAAQWLPALMQGLPGLKTQYNELIKERWRESRRDMLKVINRPSYRSVLTLYLFSQTPVPSGISEEEEMDGISGTICAQTALVQLQQLRQRLRGCQFNGSGVSVWTDAMEVSTTTPNLTQTFLDLESRVYWAAVTWDTSSAATLNLRSSLSSGLRGACFEPTWRLARAFLVGSFPTVSETWHQKGFQVSDEKASQIISAAAVCMIYTWRTIASVKEALREGVEESDTLFAWNSFLDAIAVFKSTIRPLLSACERRLHFLGQVERFNWYLISTHYYLGVLILADTVEAAGRMDLLSQISEESLDAEQESFNVLKFGLESKYRIEGPPQKFSSTSGFDSNAAASKQSITTSFVAIDPYPHHVVASIRLMKKATSRRYRQGNIKLEAYSYLLATLMRALEQLPQSSKMVLSVRDGLRDSLRLDAISVP